MQETLVATWLNTTFGGFDYAFFSAMHALAESAGNFLTPFFTFVTFIGENGLLMFALGLILMAFRKTRKIGLCIFIATGIGAVCTSIILKDLIARPRPFDASDLYYTWWHFVGAPEETSFSFPSGHVTSATAGTAALIIASKKPAAFLALFYPLVMAASRVYLISHYATDVIAGMIVGTLAAAVACWLVNLALTYAEQQKFSWYERFFSDRLTPEEMR